MKRMGFDSQKYIELQSARIRERIAQFGGKLYLEFGGKLFDDMHAARVLPGFEPDNKIRMLSALADDAEIVIAISAKDIEKNKRRADLNLTYDTEVLRLIDVFHDYGLYVGSVVVTKYDHQPAADAFIARLKRLKVKVYKHYPIRNYPNDERLIVSEDGFGRNDYIETVRRLVVVTAPGPGSGKMATCLSQLYHENRRGIQAGYAKFETFPIWSIPLGHPVNIAYEAATTDLDDVNMLDPYHMEAYGKIAVNYNRDVEIFPVLRTIFERIYGECPYKSPTDMGVNMAGFAIVDDGVCREASRQEIIRRYFRTACQVRQGMADERELEKIERMLRMQETTPEDRAVVPVTRALAEKTMNPAAAIELPDGRIVTGKTSALLGASSAALINALKRLADIDQEVDLIAPDVIRTIQTLKTEHLHSRNPRMHIDEMLIALAFSATTDKNARDAMQKLNALKDCEVHSSVILSSADESCFKRLGMNLTCESAYGTTGLYHK